MLKAYREFLRGFLDILSLKFYNYIGLCSIKQFITEVITHMKRVRFLISLSLVFAIIFSSQGLLLSASATDATNSTYLGDVNFDNSVSAIDARMILQHTAGLIELQENSLYYADCNSDGAVTAIDARMVLQVTAGLAKPQYPNDDTTQNALKEKWLNEITDKVDYDELVSDLKWIVEELGVRSWWDKTQNSAADELYKRLYAFGYTRKNCEKINFIHDGIEGVNLLATVPTSKENPDVILFVAHYDTVREVAGAVDNASGVATLLQMAKIFLQSNKDFGVELRFLFTAGEEQSYYGARNYASSLSDEEKSKHKFVFNIDMTAKPKNEYNPDEKYYITVSTEPVATDLYFSPAAQENDGSLAVDQAKALLGNLGEEGYYSPIRAGKNDTIPFRLLGIDALTLSWRSIDAQRSYGAEHDFACPSITHTTDDNMENVDFKSLYDMTRLAVGAAAQLICPYVEEF